MSLIGHNTQVKPPNLAPEWVRVPVPTFTAGVGGTYDLRNDVIDQEGDTITFVKTAGSWPTGVSMASNGVITATTGVTTGATGITVTADDGTNSPVASTSFNVTVPAANAKRWNPGHYIKTTGNQSDEDQVDYWNGVNNKIISYVEDIPEIKGAYVTAAWGSFNTTGSTYDWSQIDNTLSILKARGKKMILELAYKAFNNDPDAGVLVPADLKSQTDPTNRGWWGGVHRTATMTRFIAAVEAAATRYDDDPGMEMVVTQEPSPSFGKDANGVSYRPSDYDKADYVAELYRLYDAGSAAFTKANFCPAINSLSSYTNTLMEYVYANNDGITAPDCRPNVVAWPLFEGVDYGSGEYQLPGTPDPDSQAVRDYRGIIPRPGVVSSSTLNDGGGIYGPAATHVNRTQQQSCTHVAWYTSSSTTTWTQIKAAIQADPTVHTACPTAYPSCET